MTLYKYQKVPFKITVSVFADEPKTLQSLDVYIHTSGIDNDTDKVLNNCVSEYFSTEEAVYKHLEVEGRYDKENFIGNPVLDEIEAKIDHYSIKMNGEYKDIIITETVGYIVIDRDEVKDTQEIYEILEESFLKKVEDGSFPGISAVVMLKEENKDEEPYYRVRNFYKCRAPEKIN